MTKHFSRVLLLALCLKATAGFSQQADGINLKQQFDAQQIRLVNRSAATFAAEGKEGLRLGEASGEGLALMRTTAFGKGTIEVDLKGQDVFQKSFLGIAFHVVNDSTYDAVYFRPFNFRATDSVRRIHAVQYISHPQHTWSRLRQEQNAQFEKAVVPVPDPNEWFHARIVVGERNVQVFVNNADTPSLQVPKLNERKTGRIALWTGDGSGGSFANLVVRPD